MYTLLILILILVIYSIYDVKKKCGKWKDFNPFEGNAVSYIVLAWTTIFIAVALFIAFIKLTLKYLP